jgi:hypothetical protein
MIICVRTARDTVADFDTDLIAAYNLLLRYQ